MRDELITVDSSPDAREKRRAAAVERNSAEGMPRHQYLKLVINILVDYAWSLEDEALLLCLTNNSIRPSTVADQLETIKAAVALWRVDLGEAKS